MDNDNLTKLSGKKKKARGGKVIPALCNIAGTILILAVIAMTLPAVLPKAIKGWEAYNITSGSMTPTIPVGSVVYVETVSGEDLPRIEADEIIAYMENGELTVHRVISNHVVEGEFITKGDYNEENDPMPVPYSNVMGKVVRHYRYLGDLMTIYMSTAGKINLLIFAICGALLNILAGRLRN